jgi:hypothetical protein
MPTLVYECSQQQHSDNMHKKPSVTDGFINVACPYSEYYSAINVLLSPRG